MITVKIDIKSIDALSERLEQLQVDSMLQSVANTALSDISQRVFINGTASTGERIGTYTPGYMKVRTGNFGNTPRITKGANKGKTKQKKTSPGDAGVYTKGKDKGKPRARYNRSGDTKVVLSLTREMENDMKVVKVDNGYGIGFSNPHNYDKAVWNDERYGKRVWNLTEEEKERVLQVAQEIIHNTING